MVRTSNRSKQSKDGTLYPKGYRKGALFAPEKLAFAKEHDAFPAQGAREVTGGDGPQWGGAVVRLPSGDFYEGQWDPESKMSGRGIFYNANGTMIGAFYTGSFEQCSMHGAGQLVWRRSCDNWKANTVQGPSCGWLGNRPFDFEGNYVYDKKASGPCKVTFQEAKGGPELTLCGQWDGSRGKPGPRASFTEVGQEALPSATSNRKRKRQRLVRPVAGPAAHAGPGKWRLAKLEAEYFGEEKPGVLVDRLKALEEHLAGEVQRGSVVQRLAKLEGEIFGSP